MGFQQPSPPIRALYGDIVAALREAFKDVPGAVVRTFESFNPDGHIPKPTCAVYVKLPNIPPPKRIWQDDVYYGERLVRVSMEYTNGGTYWWVEVYTGKKVWGSLDFPTPKDTVDIAMVVLSEKMGIPAPQPAPVPESPEVERLRAENNRLAAELAGLRTYLTRAIANDLDGMDEAFEILGNMAAQDLQTVGAWVKEMSDPTYWSEEVAQLTAELAEARATLANERGEGEPPVPGFVATLEPERGDEYNPHEDVVVRWTRPWNGYSVIYVGTEADSHRWWWSIMGRTVDGKNVLLCRGDADTARASMRAASAAKVPAAS